MKKIEALKKLVEEKGTEKMKELVVLTEEYLKGLDHIFRDREVHEFILKEFDFPMFLGELQRKGVFENRSGMNNKLLVMDIYYIARHTWEFTDNRGVVKNGDDLHRAWPSMYEHDKAMTVEELFQDLHYV